MFQYAIHLYLRILSHTGSLDLSVPLENGYGLHQIKLIDICRLKFQAQFIIIAGDQVRKISFIVVRNSHRSVVDWSTLFFSYVPDSLSSSLIISSGLISSSNSKSSYFGVKQSPLTMRPNVALYEIP